MLRKWIPTMVFAAVLVAGGIWLYHSGALPFMETHHAGPDMRPSSDAQLPSTMPEHRGGGESANPLQTLPQLLGDLWLIASTITAVRILQGMFRFKAPRRASAVA